MPDHIVTTPGSVGCGLIFQMASTTTSTTSVSRDDFEKQLKYISNLAHHLFNEVNFYLTISTMII